MRVIKSDSGFLAYQKIFEHLKANNLDIVVWQVLSSSGERVVSDSRLNSFNLESGSLHFQMPSENEIHKDEHIYVYSEDGQFIFKSSILEIKNGVFSVQMPEEVKLLEEPDVQVIRGKINVDLGGVWKTKRLNLGAEHISDHMVVKSMAQRTSRDQEFLNNEFNPVSLDEEDKMYADKRESPRARPKIEKWVKIKSATSEEVHLFKLFDLSQGGIAFLTIEPELFPKGSSVRVVGFEEFDLDDPLIAKVMSHRSTDDLQIEFKVGCKFEEGQS